MATLYLDPSYFQSKFRAEFRLPKSNGIYKTDMRILNIGINKTNAGNTAYNVLTGAGGIIESIQLYSGSQLLDQVQNFSHYFALKNLLNSNTDNQSVHRPLKRNKLGYVASGFDTINAGTGAVTLAVKQNNEVPNRFNAIVGGNPANPQVNGAWLDLKDCLGFLRGSPYVPMNVYQDFRVVINYKSNPIDIIRDRNATVETLEPLLVCEYETDPEVADALMRNYQGHSFESVEHDLVQLDASAVGQDAVAEQEASYLIKGFNDKYISQIAIVNVPQDSATWRTGTNNHDMANQGSVSQLDWAYQVRVNGSNLFPKTLYEGKMRRLGQMVDSWGSMNIAFGQNICNNEGGPAAIFKATNTTQEGQVDYTGFRIDDVVKELKLNVQRDAVGRTAAAATDNANLRQALRLLIFGISRKRIVPTSSGILVQYI